VRLFLAVSPDAEARRQIAATRAALERAAGEDVAALRPVAVDLAHLTVHFLGEVDAPKLDGLIHALGLTVPIDPFEIALGATEVSPRSGPPRVVWMPVTAGRVRLTDVHAELGERLAGAGFALERRTFTPHLTVARVRVGHVARALRDRVATVRPVSIHWRVDHVTLFQSDLSGPSPQYTPRHRVALHAAVSGL
jgi:2'-5' RNA ligase